MKYKNIKTGAVIDISANLIDEQWKALEPSALSIDTEEETAPIEEEVIEEVNEETVEETAPKKVVKKPTTKKKPVKKTTKRG
nr:MAG TPA: hypothetical protein [Bacteriophage sp.]